MISQDLKYLRRAAESREAWLWYAAYSQQWWHPKGWILWLMYFRAERWASHLANLCDMEIRAKSWAENLKDQQDNSRPA